MPRYSTQELNQYVTMIQSQYASQEQPLVASLYHEASKRHNPLQPVSPVPFDADYLPAFSYRAYKEYRLAPRIQLPQWPEIAGISLDKLLTNRRTIRSFASRSLLPQQLSAVLGLSYRVTNPEAVIDETFPGPRRPVPSGGALYPLELYLAVLDVEDVAPGLYHYHPVQHCLEELHQTAPEPALKQCITESELPANTALALCICGIIPRTCFKYGELGYRLMLLEAGHVTQNVITTAQALGLGTLPYCSFYDDKLHHYLGVDGVDEVYLYVIWIGWPPLDEPGT